MCLTHVPAEPPPPSGATPFLVEAPDKGWQRWLPGLAVLRHYEAAWLPRDLAAGLVLTTMLVPVGIAYAVASGVPGIYGLYATIIPLLAYALFGPSRIGTFKGKIEPNRISTQSAGSMGSDLIRKVMMRLCPT